MDQTREALVNIGKSDDPLTTFDSFVLETNLPNSFRAWESINADDQMQVATIWSRKWPSPVQVFQQILTRILDVRYSTSVIDYYLNAFVFPRHAKQFNVKMQLSGWDLPILPASLHTGEQAKFKELPRTTGFSGTNDNRDLLPLTITQDDLPSLQHTNAEVLSYLLQFRNQFYHYAASDSGRRLTEHELLKRLRTMGIKVLIDSGAMILEMSNLDVAKTWLVIDDSADAALYFNTSHEPMLLYKNGKEVPLIGSNLVDDLTKVLVYIGKFLLQWSPAHLLKSM